MKKAVYPAILLTFVGALVFSTILIQSPSKERQDTSTTVRQTLNPKALQELIQQNKVLTEKVDDLSLGLAALSTQLRDLKRQEPLPKAPPNNTIRAKKLSENPSKKKRIQAQSESLDLSSIETEFGEPEAVTSRERNYYKKGVSVRLDESGFVESVTYHGQHASDSQDVNGNYGGLFQKDGRWYRPQLWTVNGLTVGDSIDAVLGELGLSDETLTDINSQQYLYYRSKKLTVKVSAPPHSRVLGFRLGTKPSNDINGNIGF